MKNELEQERNTKLNSQQSVVSDLAFKLERNTSNGTRKDSLYAEWMKADYTLKEMNPHLSKTFSYWGKKNEVGSGRIRYV